ncbi:hypothetical protein WH52_07790 [Tenacibaculum holothuriorum]|uniref:Uncharacterized protein n=1 Tax=Tenacibaculum holothuriorum TaxID=1635173 RepID=A0A1Y2PBS6_9FLAO|nr:hypothetical protein [Tenacibaculum holothuriorum]OSY87936.1 hypothetical protein WH52_07790 [Tenacibaculum holothuriorum]
MLDLIGEVLVVINDILFWRRKKKRRKFEKENNLPKKRMVNPLAQIIIGLIVLIVIFRVLRIIIK